MGRYLSVFVATMFWLTSAVNDVQTTLSPVALPSGEVRALVFSPHPDDATLGAGGLIQRLRRQGGRVRVIELTSGDAFPRGVRALRSHEHVTPSLFRWYGDIREREALEAMHQLGVGRAGLRFLGFPDEGLCVLASAARSGPAFKSWYTTREAPPLTEQVVPGTMYVGNDLVAEVARLIGEFKPTLVVLPHAGDEHPDHCASHVLVHQGLTAATVAGMPEPHVLHYVIHFRDWPLTQSDGAALGPPSGDAPGQWQWRTFELTAKERASKVLAVSTFHSQMLVMPDFLRAFEHPNELFIEGEPTQPTACWCNGENITPPPGRVP